MDCRWHHGTGLMHRDTRNWSVMDRTFGLTHQEMHRTSREPD